jgi:HlyD family secretion protein
LWVLNVKRLLLLLALAVLLAGGAAGYAYWLQERSGRVPEGMARANGRIEVERVDVAAKLAGRIAELTVNEGSDVRKDEILVRLDTTEALAQLAAASAAVHRAHQGVAHAEADVALREAELRLAEVELRRAEQLVRTKAGTIADLDRRTAQRDISAALLNSA